MIILDTCALIFDALSPEKLSKKAKEAISEGEKHAYIHCCDISLWEIAMLIRKERIAPGIDTQSFLNLVLAARTITVLEITSSIATLATGTAFKHNDPADRIIAGTALCYGAPLVTCDNQLSKIPKLDIIW